MSMTDPIADMLTRIRNASRAEHKIVDIPASKLKTSIARTLYNRGFIRGFRLIEDDKQGILRVYLAYRNDQPLIVGLKRVSKPGCRVYTNADSIPRVMGGKGIAVLTTPRGVLTDAEARKQHVGGEVLLHVW
ncbi:MAG: 30S ribosomal protein S8 [Candidatus Fermentibacteraceae bacterium]|nr:30S ribosomal protein S8 [Candidatus Fermentibacteraceae bacterium]MBN2609775.1 30S ribosomal protein S8 [Candidatus Fermentibacteraceae bacterium]